MYLKCKGYHKSNAISFKDHLRIGILSLLFLTYTPLVSATNSFDRGWRKISPGILYKEFSANTLSPFAKLHVLDIDVNENKINFCNVSKIATASDLTEDIPASIIFNGAFFSKSNKPLGLRVSNGKLMSKYKGISWWHTFYIKNNLPYISHQYFNEKSIKEFNFALQSGPRLIHSSQIVPLKEGVSSRTALGILQNKHVVVVISEFALISTNDLATFMLEHLGCTDALNLDGGSSTQLSINLPDFKKNIIGLAKLPDPICIYSK